MNLIELNRALHQLRLGGMVATLETRLQQAQTESMAPIDLISTLVSDELLEAIPTFPVHREVEHCGARLGASPFDSHVDCPRCGAHIKVRSFSALGEIEDVFDAVFEWMNRPMAEEEARRRQMALKDDEETE